MKVFWWNGGVQIQPESDVETEALLDRDLLVRVIDLLRELDANQTKPDAVIPVTPRQEPRQETT